MIYLLSLCLMQPPKDVVRSSPNIFKGQNYYNKSGARIGYSRPNILGGSNYYRNGLQSSYSYKSGKSTTYRKTK